MPTTIATRLLNGFDDPRLGAQRWNKLLRAGDTDAVNLTWEWQRSWWQSFAKGRLLLVAVEVDDEIIAIAPLFTDGGMIYNLCPEDRLDFIGDIGDTDVLIALLETARNAVPDFAGFTFYFVPDCSRTPGRLRVAAAELHLSCHDGDVLPSPYIDLRRKRDAALACTRKKSLLRHENAFRREGVLDVIHARHAAEILPHLDAFFDQHIRRRAATTSPSLFVSERQRDYYRRLTSELSDTGWLRFTRISFNGRPIAFHHGLCYGRRYLFGIPSFEIELCHKSPGEVLLRQLMLAAIEEDAEKFDFGIGDERYKYRFATDVVQLKTISMYPTGASQASGA